jgi:hypothetical protein
MCMRQILGLILAISLGFCLPGMICAEETESASTDEATLTSDSEEEDILSELKTVHGKRERRRFRVKRWGTLLKGDMSEVYEAYGYPSSRYREEVMGRVVERWTYLEEGRQLTFSNGELLKERRFTPRSP